MAANGRKTTVMELRVILTCITKAFLRMTCKYVSLFRCLIGATSTFTLSLQLFKDEEKWLVCLIVIISLRLINL